jgi:HD-GYP domain-containing protein (c-di-GMP phosphodiesterase class II)
MVEASETSPRQEETIRRERARKSYATALASIKEVAQKMTTGGHAGVRKARRMMQNMVDLVMEDETVLLGLTTIRRHDDYTYTHSVNVALLSVCLGKRIGLSRASLEQLGICGLFHDLGKVKVSPDILRKAGDLTAGEWEKMRRHPIASVNQILKLRASRGLKAKILLAPFEHHQRNDLLGYPQVRTKREMSLFGRILGIADVFDALTSPRSYRPMAYGPDYALSLMMDGAGKEFDPILLKAFVNMMGVYPVGTLLELDTGEWGLVADSPVGADRSRPRLLLLQADGSGGLKRGEIVDLSEKEPVTGGFKRTPVRSLHPAVRGIQPAQFLL